MSSALASANYGYLVPAIAIYFVSLVFRAYRWRFLLAPFRSISWHRLYPVVAVGYMANNLLPVRLGEVVRSYYLARREPVPASTALATVVSERVFDGVALLFFLAVAALFLPLAGLAERVSEAVHLPVALVAFALVAPFAAAAGMMVAMALYPARFRRVATSLIRLLPPRLGAVADSLIERFIDGFRGLHHPRRLAAVFLLSLPVWLVEGAMYYVVALGFDLDSHLGTVWHMAAAMLLITALANLATALPSSQGSIGPFEFFVVLSLESVAVSGAVASAYALVLHAALLLPVTLVGLAHLAMNSVRLTHLTGEPQPAGRVAETGSTADQVQ